MLTDVKRMHFYCTQQFNTGPASAHVSGNRHFVVDTPGRQYSRFPFNIHQILGMTRQVHYREVTSPMIAGHMMHNVDPSWSRAAPGGCFDDVTCTRSDPKSDVTQHVNIGQKLMTLGGEKRDCSRSGEKFYCI